MFLACGLGAYPLAVFHLAAHAYFKGYQFITAPSILHLLHGGPDVTKTSSREKVPVISWLFLAGALALVIFPFLAGSLPVSKFGDAVTQGFLVLLALGVIAAFSAAFNSARLTGVAFDEEGHNGHARDAHERSGLLSVKPMLAMAVIALIGIAFGILPGGINGTWFQQLLSPVVSANIGVPAGSALLAIILLVLMILLVITGWLTPLYFDRFRLEESAGSVSPFMRRLYNLTLNRFWLDELYEAAFVSPIGKLALLLDRFDREVIDRTTGVPAPAPLIRVAGQTWQEQFIAMQSAQAAASEGAKHEVATRWEESDERAALAAAQAQVLGRVPAAGFVASRWVEQESVGGTENLFGRLMELAAGISGWFEQRVIGGVTENLFGRLTELAAGISGWFEQRVIGGVEDMFSRLTELAAAVSARVENLVFQKGVHGGVPAAGQLLGRVLTRTEDLLGNPLVIGLIFLFSIIALLVGAL
jgi:NADH-quinone oxidoreductase subunit L